MTPELGSAVTARHVICPPAPRVSSSSFWLSSRGSTKGRSLSRSKSRTTIESRFAFMVSLQKCLECIPLFPLATIHEWMHIRGKAVDGYR
ncbi:MAG: hypothetical protein BJ554DRAFT_1237 [Olpidium bornovanus]|uniref:Uncharacterized protein n=1 Tax=Olpidium bornovanus TaxID=278681 RepID=A0A8H8A1E0_9FUNG|nr:MAG: hypothetical protein BJ554DRAFT_1237 [Olpidium bornovanus]